MASKYQLMIKTVQISSFKANFSALKDILIDTNMIFDAEGIKIIDMDKSMTILVNMHLQHDRFEKYECIPEKIVIGVNIEHLFKLISTVDTDDMLTICILNEDYCNGDVEKLTFMYENSALKRHKTMPFKVIDANAENMEYPDVAFSSIVRFKSAEFQKNIRDAKTIMADTLEIKTIGDELVFYCDGQFIGYDLHYSNNSELIQFIKQTNRSVVVQGTYSVKHLGYFIKCTPLCEDVEISMQNDVPLVVKYTSSLGYIKMCLAPKTDI